MVGIDQDNFGEGIGSDTAGCDDGHAIIGINTRLGDWIDNGNLSVLA